MSTVPAVFEEFYKSSYHHPYLILFLNAVFGLFLLMIGMSKLQNTACSTRVRLFLRTYLPLFLIIASLDAWLTANTVLGIGTLTGVASTVIPLLFVILGDFRVFLLLETLSVEPQMSHSFQGQEKNIWLRAFAWSMITPLLFLGLRNLPALANGADPRNLYLAYEVCFLGVIFIWRLTVLKRREVGMSTIMAESRFATLITIRFVPTIFFLSSVKCRSLMHQARKSSA